MKIFKFMALAMLVCCGIGMLFSCGNGNAVTGVESTELLRTSQSWNGMELPDYPQGRPELVAVKYVIPPGQKLGWHHHVSMNHGVLVQGELKIIGKDGKTTVLRVNFFPDTESEWSVYNPVYKAKKKVRRIITKSNPTLPR